MYVKVKAERKIQPKCPFLRNPDQNIVTLLETERTYKLYNRIVPKHASCNCGFENPAVPCRLMPHYFKHLIDRDKAKETEN